MLVGSYAQQKEILAVYPILNDKKHLPWDGDPRKVVEAMLARLSKSEKKVKIVSKLLPAGRQISLPRIKKGFTQREKDLFLKDTFSTIREYFKEALSQLEGQHKEVETDFSEIHNFKFFAKIYVNGEIKSQCKIWIGGISSSNSIAFYSGRIDIDNDGTMNDWLTVEENDFELDLKPSGMGFGRFSVSEKELLNKEKAAEYFWQRFTEYLG